MAVEPNNIQPWTFTSTNYEPADPTVIDISNPFDVPKVDLNTLITNARDSGVSPNIGATDVDGNPVNGGVATDSVLDTLLNSAKGAFGTVSDWVKANPDLAKMMGLGISTAQQQQYAKDLAAQKNQWSIDAINAANARADQLWQRRNDSITGSRAANLGIIGQALIDPTIYARK